MDANYTRSLYYPEWGGFGADCKLNLVACRELLPELEIKSHDDVPRELLEKRAARYVAEGGVIDLRIKDLTINHLPCKGVLERMFGNG